MKNKKIILVTFFLSFTILLNLFFSYSNNSFLIDSSNNISMNLNSDFEKVNEKKVTFSTINDYPKHLKEKINLNQDIKNSNIQKNSDSKLNKKNSNLVYILSTIFGLLIFLSFIVLLVNFFKKKNFFSFKNKNKKNNTKKNFKF